MALYTHGLRRSSPAAMTRSCLFAFLLH